MDGDIAVKLPYKAVLQIAEAVNEGNSVMEIQHSINVGSISNPLLHGTDKALLTLANRICTIRGLQEINILEEPDTLKCELDVGVAALVRAIERTAMECDEICHLINTSAVTQTHPQTHKGHITVESLTDMHITMHDNDILTDDVSDSVEQKLIREDCIEPFHLPSETNISKVRNNFLMN